jgi:5-methylcytosine-specific restriction endonuclease McrBC GTP-binding regulatory subunit McrB
MSKNKPIQKIIFGSPGTGKSHRIDSEIIPNDLQIDASKNPENIIKAVFHPEYTYSDFIGKLLPITRGGKVEYNFYEGHFLRALGQAYKNYIRAHDKQGNLLDGASIENVVLVIDEINRGNSSSIFGSIFQLLDRDESGWSSYSININGVAFIRILELIGVSFSYDSRGDVDEYKLKPYDGVKKLETLQEKINFLKFDLINRTIKIPPNLSIVATMNTSDSSIYYMDSAFKRRWDWEFIDIKSARIFSDGVAFKNRNEWINFLEKLNEFIRSNHRYIRGIEDKQIGQYFIKSYVIEKSIIQSKLMFFLWDSVFARDKKPLASLIYADDASMYDNLITFGDFAKQVDIFIEKIKDYNV